MSMMTEMRRERTRLEGVIKDAQEKAGVLDQLLSAYGKDNGGRAQAESRTPARNGVKTPTRNGVRTSARNGMPSKRREPCPVPGCTERPKPGAGLAAHMRARHPDYVLQ